MEGKVQETGDQIKSAALHALADNKPMDVERTGSSRVDNLGGPLVSKKARTENVEARAPAVEELLFSDEECQIEKLSSCVEDNVKTNAADGFIGFEKCRNRNCRRPKELSGPLVSKKVGTENLEAPAPAVKDLLCADEEGQIDYLLPDVVDNVKTNAADGSEEVGDDHYALRSWLPIFYYIGKLPDLMRDKIHDLKTDPSCCVDSYGSCNCNGKFGPSFQYEVFELLAVRVKLPVHDGKAFIGHVALAEEFTHLIYDETKAVPCPSDGPILEGYDPSYLLLEGPNVPARWNDGVAIFASIPPHPAHALELATIESLSKTKGLPVCMFGEYISVSYISIVKPILARVEVITYPQESKLKDGKTKVFGMIRAQNSLCRGKAVVLEHDQSDSDYGINNVPTDSRMMIKLCRTFPVETLELPPYDSPMLDQLLFRKNKNQAVHSICPGRRIKLSRYVLSLRKDCSLTLKVQLYGIGDEPNSYYEIANGEEMFQVQCGGVTEKIIHGKSGSVWVKVAWNIDLRPQYKFNGDHETPTMIAVN